MTLLYVSVANATTYFSTRLYTDEWDNATDATKAAALHMAERLIESTPWRGQRYDLDRDDQPGEWPRYIDGVAVDYDEDLNTETVPTEILEAIYEEALALLKVGDSPRAKLRSEGVKSFNIGGKLSETFTGSKDLSEAEELGFKSAEAYRLVSKWIYRGGPVY